jgi:hypothetical protein
MFIQVKQDVILNAYFAVNSDVFPRRTPEATAQCDDSQFNTFLLFLYYCTHLQHHKNECKNIAHNISYTGCTITSSKIPPT